MGEDDQNEVWYQSWKQRLHFSSEPTQLLVRQEQYEQVKSFVLGGCGSTGGVLFLTGLPGTGKSSTVKRVATDLRDMQNNPAIWKDEKRLKFVWLNGLHVSNTAGTFSLLWKGISGRWKNHKVAQMALSNFFKARATAKSGAVVKRRKIDVANQIPLLGGITETVEGLEDEGDTIIVMIDEMDQLVQHSLDFLYSVLDWSNREKSGCRVIAIANTLDISTQLSKRIQSRMGKQSIAFQPYTKDELALILVHRLKDPVTVFSLTANHPRALVPVLHCIQEVYIQVCAGKVAQIWGDARQALRVLALAGDRAYHALHKGDRDTFQVTVEDIRAGHQNLLGTVQNTQDSIYLSLYERLVLYVMVRASEIGDSYQIKEWDILQRVLDLTEQLQLDEVPVDRIQRVILRLVHRGLLAELNANWGAQKSLFLPDTTTLTVRKILAGDSRLSGLRSDEP